ncbi:MAG: sensor histidine kinase [Spirochaetota bacterium]
MRRLLLPILVSSGCLWAGDLDLSGAWQVRLVSCLPGEKQCQLHLNAEPQSLELPANLHAIYPWFYGEAVFERTFQYENAKEISQHDLIILGSIGSVDETRINGILIGKEGYRTQNVVLSAWNKVRAYEIPEGTLLNGTNTIQIKITVLDHKAGIHAGPLKLTDGNSARYSLLALQIWREYIFVGIPLLLMIVVVAFLMVVAYWQKRQGNAFLVLAFFSYFMHSFYFLPIPLGIDYLNYAKLQWIARIWSVMFSALYFARNLGYFRWHHEIIWLILGFSLSASTIMVSDFWQFANNMLWNQIGFLSHLFYPFIFYRKTLAGPRRTIYRRYLPQSLGVLAFYVHDTLVIGYQLNTPWLFHYMSIINVIHFLDHFSFHLYLWRDRGRHEAEMEHAHDKLRMAHELHDIVGAELSQMVVLSRELEAAESRDSLTRLAAGALEKIRDFAHILKNEREVDSLPEILEKLRTRLHTLRRYDVRLFANAPHVTLSDSVALPFATAEKRDPAAVLRISPFTRMHIERILSEWSSNVIRHARAAKRLVLGWQLRPHKVRIFFFQDSTPFRWSGQADRGGLKGLEFRAREIGASIACRKRNGGTLMLLVVPLEE